MALLNNRYHLQVFVYYSRHWSATVSFGEEKDTVAEICLSAGEQLDSATSR